MKNIIIILIVGVMCLQVNALATITLLEPANNTNYTSSPVFIFNANSDTNTTLLCYLNITKDVPAIYKYGSVASGSNKVWNTYIDFSLDNYTWNIVCDDTTGNYSSGFNRFNITNSVTQTSSQYGDITTPITDFNNIIGMVCILVGIWGMYHYTIESRN